MSKIRINSSIINEVDNKKTIVKTIGIKENNKISYNDNKVNVTILINDNKINMTREEKEYILKLNFDCNNDTKGTYLIEEIGTLEIEIKTKNLKITMNNVYIEYELKLGEEYLGIYKYNLEFEVI